MLILGTLTGGCASKSEQKLREKNAFLEGQNAALLQQQQLQQQQLQLQQQQAAAQNSAQTPGVTIVGAVQRSQVPWVAGLTLAQAISTANYIGQDEPKQIIITRNGESATLDAKQLLNGADVPLEVGDVIELK